MKLLIISIYSLLFFVAIACSDKQQTKGIASTIDSTLQVKVTDILENKLSEIDAISGKVIVMETNTKAIKAIVSLKKNSIDYREEPSCDTPQETGLFSVFSTIAALESGKVKYNDTFDTGNGVFVYNGDTIKDCNWQRGGYGELNIEQGIGVSSNITMVKEVLQAFGNNPQGYFNELAKLGIKADVSDKLHYAALGYNQNLTPIQLVELFNNIANDSLPASKLTMQNIRTALEASVKDGLDKPANSDRIKVAGKSGIIQISDSIYRVEFCGYFPAGKPKYTILVTIDKANLPVSGGLMAGDVFRKIVESLTK